jgi:tetratricopeptide (TPR) repeat protein
MDAPRRISDELRSERARRRLAGLGALAVLWTLALAVMGAGAAALLAPVLVAGAVFLVVLVLGHVSTAHARADEPSARAVDLNTAVTHVADTLRPHVARLHATATRLLGAVRRPTREPKAAPRQPSQLDEARRLSEASASLREQGRLDEAVASAEVAVRLFASLGDRRREALALNRLALAHAKAGRQADAIPILERAATMLGELGDPETEGRVIANIGTLHESEGRHENAVLCWHDALAKLEPDTPAHERVAERLRATA